MGPGPFYPFAYEVTETEAERLLFVLAALGVGLVLLAVWEWRSRRLGKR